MSRENRTNHRINIIYTTNLNRGIKTNRGYEKGLAREAEARTKLVTGTVSSVKLKLTVGTRMKITGPNEIKGTSMTATMKATKVTENKIRSPGAPQKA